MSPERRGNVKHSSLLGSALVAECIALALFTGYAGQALGDSLYVDDGRWPVQSAASDESSAERELIHEAFVRVTESNPQPQILRWTLWADVPGYEFAVV